MKKTFTYSPNPFSKMSKGFAKFPIEFVIYVPNRDKNGKKASDKEFKKRIKEVENKLLLLFGGHSTDQLENGTYLSKNKKIINEKISKISCFSKIKVYKKQRKELEDFLIKKKKEWNQETIGYEFEGDLYYV